MEVIGLESQDSYEYQFRLTRAGHNGKLKDVELFFPGPWTSVFSTSKYESLSDVGYNLFGYWVDTQGIEESLELLQKALTPIDLYEQGYRTKVPVEGCDLILEMRAAHIDEVYEETIRVKFKPVLWEAEDDAE